jgi:hypothetical protein
MIVCNKCNIEKPIDQYFKETRKDNGKTYIKKYCNDCFRKQSRDWKRNNRISKTRQLEIDKEEQRVKHLLINGAKNCSICNELKLPDEYYSHRTMCKDCVRHIEREKDRVEREERDRQREIDGISNKRVPNKAGDFADELQRRSTHEFLTLLGWSYNPDNKIYYKEPIKSATGFWRGIEPNKNNTSLDRHRKRARIRKWVTEKTLPKLVLEKHRRQKTPPDELLNKCMYEYFINKTPGYIVARDNGITEGYVTHYVEKIFEMLYDKVE